MKGLAILIGDIGHGKTTLARRLLDALPPEEFEAAMLVVVHAGVTANWLLKRIAQQLGVAEPADDKLTILSQLYARLVEIHECGRRAVVLIDEAQMLASRELMEEFRGLLNLEVPGHKLVSFVFFGLPDIERNLLLDPALSQRVALRCHLRSLGLEETVAYVSHRLKLAGAKDELLPRAAIEEVHRLARGVPRVINTLCDNVLLELFFAKQAAATSEIVLAAAENLGLTGRDLTPPAPVERLDQPATPGTPGEDAVLAVTRSSPGAVAASGDALGAVDPDGIASRVAEEGATAAARGNGGTDIADPLSFLAPGETEPLAPAPAEPITADDDAVEVTFESTGDEGGPGDSAPADDLVLPDDDLALPDVDPALIKPRLVVPAPPAGPPGEGEESAAAPLPTLAEMAAPLPSISSRPLPGPLGPPRDPAPPRTSPGAPGIATLVAPPPQRPRPVPADLPGALPTGPSAAARAFAAALGVDAPGVAAPELEGEGDTVVVVAPVPPPRPVAPAPRAINTGGGTIDLDAIDDLLADIKKR